VSVSGRVNSRKESQAACADKAVQELRKKGLAAASKKASRHAAEGLVGVSKSDRAAAVVEVGLWPAASLLTSA
jgi:translation elongation factor EF-Ts